MQYSVKSATFAKQNISKEIKLKKILPEGFLIL